MIVTRLLFALALMTDAGPALAQANVPAPLRNEALAMAQLCRADYDRLCPGVQPGGGRILACLQRQVPQLSVPCAQAMPRAQVLERKAKAAGVLPN